MAKMPCDVRSSPTIHGEWCQQGGVCGDGACFCLWNKAAGKDAETAGKPCCDERIQHAA
ncbi:hypothetical protein LHGZ1_0017 [Laribacter hongkongensis]|uniref:Uncharacterized protein n=1 Tax=Laribacter hongkongensis TaxID=168471 RepID=A0A248LDJ5_9NEIS|nr:hypothetical protein LHGZ1_0017 [Laribacter hongkongensis]